MTRTPLPPRLKATLEYGPTFAFVVAYLVFRNDSFVIGGTEYAGLVALIAVFTPIFVITMGALWVLTGTIARIQLAAAIMVLVFGGLSVWLNDSTVFKMKPTAIYLTLAVILGTGLLRGQSWLMYIMEDTVPLKKKGWMILTKRVLILFVLSAGANELVWRTQSERVWLVFETLVMPIVVLLFFVMQIGLFIDYAKLKPSKTKRSEK